MTDVVEELRVASETLSEMEIELSGQMRFVYVNNSLNAISETKSCCAQNCIALFDECDEGNGYITLNENLVNYIECNQGGQNKVIKILAENRFTNQEAYKFTKSLFYYEVQIKTLVKEFSSIIQLGMENETNSVKIFLHDDGKATEKMNISDDEFTDNSIDHNLKGGAHFPKFDLNVDDTIGCGLVMPPKKKPKNDPFIFFTYNKRIIGKGVIIREQHDNFRPFICLRSASVEINFGHDFNRPFGFNILLLLNHMENEFYSDDDFDENLIDAE